MGSYPVRPAQKRRRAWRACDFCHARGLKCRRAPGFEGSNTTRRQSTQEAWVGCLTCPDYGVECTMDRPVRKRGRKPAVLRSTEPQPEHEPGSESESRSGPRCETDQRPTGHRDAEFDTNFRSLQATRQLMQIYRDTMYQCYFPFLPENDLLKRWENGIPDPDDGPSYMLLMALCAVSSQTVALNAVFDNALLEGLPVHDSDKYFSEAASKIPARIPNPQDLDYLRCFGLLAVYSLRRGDHGDLHRYLGLYHALVAQNGFHDEGRWPDDISLSDVDDRRRFFWCVYRLEIHSACVLGHVVRMPESQVSVLYPRITPAMEPETQAWTAGWDYITDLFRLLEYAILSLRRYKNRRPILATLCDPPSAATLLDGLARLEAAKPRILLGLARPDDRRLQTNRCKYMAVQITCTEALVNVMALLYCQAPAREVMDVVEGFLDEVTKAPLIMFKVASSQIVHNLLGVGHMLYNASRYDCDRYRSESQRLIAFLADLVKNLEHDIPSAAEAGDRLRRLAEASS